MLRSSLFCKISLSRLFDSDILENPFMRVCARATHTDTAHARAHIKERKFRIAYCINQYFKICEAKTLNVVFLQQTSQN